MDWKWIFQQILEFIPHWVFRILLIGILILIIILLIVMTYKVISGKATFRIGNFKFENNRLVEDLQKQFEELNETTNLKTHVIKLLDQAFVSMKNLDNLSPNEFLKKVNNFYDFFLPGIINIIKKKDNLHRIAVFYKANDKELKILHGYGYSPEGKENLTLELYKSKAGFCYINNESYFNNDISTDPTFKRNPKSSRRYYSLICVPINYGSHVIGVLNMDGLKKDSFHKDDIDYLTYFANAISPILNKEIKYMNELSQKEAIYN